MKKVQTFEVSRPSGSEKSLAAMVDEQVNAWLVEKEKQRQWEERKEITIHEMCQTIIAREQFLTVVLVSLLYSED